MNTLLVSDSVGGMLKSHSDYDVVNDEWEYRSGSMSDYVVNGLRAIDYGRNSYEFYKNVEEYYVRDEYDVGYNRCTIRGGILEKRYMLDPWKRQFVIFPCYFCGIGKYDRTSAGEQVKGYTWDKFKVTKEGDIKQLVYIISTSINGKQVYCVDWLRDRYVL